MNAFPLRAVALLFVFGAFELACAQPRSVPEDAFGRPLLDSHGQRLRYPYEPSIPATSAASAIAQLSSPLEKRTLLAPHSTGASPSYHDQWRTTAFGSGIGATGMWPVDIDSDGVNELVLGGGSGYGGNLFWSILKYSAQDNEYEIWWQSDGATWSDAIGALRVVETAGAKRVWVGRANGRIEVFNALTRARIDTLNPSSSGVSDFALADGDNDGSIDLIAATGSQLFLYDPITLELRGTVPYGAPRIAVANVDADDRSEIVLSSGRVLDVSGGVTTVDWETTEFGARIDAADIDGDGMAEIVAAQSWYTIRAWDVDLRSTKWSYGADLDIAAFRLQDVTGDGVVEVIYGDGQWGSIYALDAATRSTLWEIPNPEHGVTDVAVIDSDSDGELEVLWGAGWSSSGPDYLYVHDLATREREWMSVDYNGPYEAIDLGDVDADGRLEIVVASYESESGYADGLVMVFDAATRELEWRSDSNMFGRHAWTGIHGLKLVNVDSDAQLEIVVTTDRLYDGALYVIDGSTHVVQKQAIYDRGSPLGPMDAVDLTGDGRPEIIAGNLVAHSGSPGVFLYALDPFADEPLWRSATLAGGFGGVTDVLAADVGNPGVDLLAVSSAVHVIRWSDRRHLTSATTGYLSVAALNVTGGTELEIVAGSENGVIDVLDGETLAVLDSRAPCSDPIHAIQMHLPGQVILTCDGDLIVYDINADVVRDVAATSVAALGRSGGLARGVSDGRSVVLASGSQAILFADLSGNHLPVLEPLSATAHWRGATDLQLIGSDADGDALRFEASSLPRLGSIAWTDAAAGQLRYTAAGLGRGEDTFTVRASDGAQYSEEQSIGVTLTNTAPQTASSSITLHWRGAQTRMLSGLDPDNDPIAFQLGTSGAHGLAALSAAGEFTYTPSGAFVGTDRVTYFVDDGADTSAPGALDVVLTNAAPTASSAVYNITPGAAVHGRIAAEDANGDPLTYSTVRQPNTGAFELEAETGLFRYTPTAGAAGVDSVVITVSDGVSQDEATLEFRHPSTPPSSGGGGGGGGSGGGGGGGGALLLLLGAVAGSRRALNVVR